MVARSDDRRPALSATSALLDGVELAWARWPLQTPTSLIEVMFAACACSKTSLAAARSLLSLV